MENHDVKKPYITNLLTDCLYFTSLNYVSVVTDTENLASLRCAVSELWRGEKVDVFNAPPPKSRVNNLHYRRGCTHTHHTTYIQMHESGAGVYQTIIS